MKLLRALAILAFAIVAPAPAQSLQPVDLALVLAVDASGSVDQVRFELQKQGYVAAFRHPRVIGAIQSGPTQSIAVIMVQWTGPALQVIAVPWTRITDAASANAFADKIAAAPRALFGGGSACCWPLADDRRSRAGPYRNDVRHACSFRNCCLAGLFRRHQLHPHGDPRAGRPGL